MQLTINESVSPSTRIERGLVRVALAVLIGTAGASALAGFDRLAAYTLAAVLGGWCVACDRRARALSASSVEPALSVRSGSPAAVGDRVAVPRATTLVIIGLLAFLRAAPRAPPELEPARAFVGVWHAGPSFGAEVRGNLHSADGRTRRIEVASGVLRDRECVRFEPAGEASRIARGPVAPANLAAPIWTARADELIRVTDPPRWRKLLEPFDALRAGVLARCRELDDPTARQLAGALLVGDNGSLSPELADLFTRTGLRHVLAVSGMHVALLAAIVWWPAGGASRARGRTRRATIALALLQATVLAIYVVVSGNGAPVRRASLALALALLARAFVVDASSTPRRPDALSLASLGFCAEVVCEPRELESLSLTLSYAATLGLILGTAPIARALREFLGVRRALTAPRLKPLPLVAIVALRATSLACTACAASIAAVMATLPLCWSSFGEWSPIGLVATPLTLPLFAWLLAYGWAWVALPGWLPAEAFEAPARWLLSTLEIADGLAGTPAVLPQRPLLLLIAASVLFFLALREAPWRRACARLACAVWAALLLPWSPSPRSIEVVALDVGHGSAVALRAPGPRLWLFDCGSKDRAYVTSHAIGPLLAHWDARELNLVLSHADRDHASALPWLVERYAVATWAGALPAPIAERLAHTTTVLDLENGLLDLEPTARDGLRLSLLRGAPLAGNEGSRSLLVEHDRARLLLCGDGVDAGLLPLLERDELRSRVDVLLWPHHGAESPWMGRALRQLAPAQVWLSASAAAPIERELERRGIRVRATARDGPLTWSPAGGSWHGSR